MEWAVRMRRFPQGALVLAALPNTVDEIAKDVGVSTRTVSDYLRAFEGQGLARKRPGRGNEAVVWERIEA